MTTEIKVITAVCQALTLTADNLHSTSQRREFIDARYIAWHILHDRYSMADMANLGGLFGRDRQTAIIGVRKARLLLMNNKDFSEKYKRVIELL